jgi:hypothetical protein
MCTIEIKALNLKSDKLKALNKEKIVGGRPSNTYTVIKNNISLNVSGKIYGNNNSIVIS